MLETKTIIDVAIFFINLDNWFSINIRFCKMIEIMTAIKISSFIILISSDFKLQFELKFMPSFMFNFNQIFNDFKRTSTFLLFLLFRQLLYIIALWMLMTCFKILYVWRIACLLIFLFFRFVIVWWCHFGQTWIGSFFAGQLYVFEIRNALWNVINPWIFKYFIVPSINWKFEQMA